MFFLSAAVGLIRRSRWWSKIFRRMIASCCATSSVHFSTSNQR